MTHAGVMPDSRCAGFAARRAGRLAAGAAAGLLVVSAVSAGAQPTGSANPLTPSAYGPIPAGLTEDALAKLGFHKTTESINAAQYAQLRVALYVPGGINSSQMDQCPDKGIFDFDVKSVVRGDLHTTIGVQVTEPLITSAAVLNPLDFSVHTGGLFGTGFLGSSSCNLSFNVINFTSPLYAVSSFNGRPFAVQTIYTTSTKLSPATQADLNTFLSAAASVAGVTATVAAPYLDQVKNGLAGAQVANNTGVTQNLVIAPGPVHDVVTWVVPGAIKKTDSAPARDVILIAQVIPVEDLVLELGGSWTSSDVLNTSFNYANAPAGAPTLDTYVSGAYSATLQQYVGAATDAQADTACQILRGQMQAAQLSDHDRVLTMWATTKKRLITSGATDASIDNLTCMNNDWPKLAALGVMRTPTPPKPSADDAMKTPGTAPTVAQMINSAYANEAFSLFFVSNVWTDQESDAEQLFQYPVEFNDPAAAVTRGTATVKDSDGWLGDFYVRDQANLDNVGCYAFFDINADNLKYASQFGTRSIMMAIGHVPKGQSPLSGKEVALRIAFAPTQAGANPKIAQIDVLTSLTATDKSAMLAALGKPMRCRSGYQPAILFGS